jgi:hypothetical protein
MNQNVSITGSAELELPKAEALKLGSTVVFIVEGHVARIGKEDTATRGVRDIAGVKLGTIMLVSDKGEANNLRERMAAWREEHETGGVQQTLPDGSEPIEAEAREVF